MFLHHSMKDIDLVSLSSVQIDLMSTESEFLELPLKCYYRQWQEYICH